MEREAAAFLAKESLRGAWPKIQRDGSHKGALIIDLYQQCLMTPIG